MKARDVALAYLSQDQSESVVLDRVYRLIAEAVVRRGGR